MKILSFGAGMQSTALALMACENAMNDPAPYPMVPVYDAVIFCDLGLEPLWVHTQMEFTRKACEAAGIFFKVLDTPLYQDFVENFGERRTISIPWWTLRKDGHKKIGDDARKWRFEPRQLPGKYAKSATFLPNS